MALRGNLRNFQPAEVLQFLTQSGKTGTLKVADATDVKYVAFTNGQITYIVHQRQLPPVSDLLLFRGMITEAEYLSRQGHGRWDEDVSRALARRRAMLARPTQIPEAKRTDSRLAEILVAQGKLTQDELGMATAPERMPDKFLEQILRSYGAISEEALLRIRREVHTGTSFYEAVVKSDDIPKEVIDSAISHMPADSLSKLLAFHGVVSRAETRQYLDQLQALRCDDTRTIRLGEYLVAKGLLTQRQLEQALAEQLTHHHRLGSVLTKQGVLTQSEIEKANRDLEALCAEFSPIASLQDRLLASHGVTRTEVAAAVRQHNEEGKWLADYLVASGKLTGAQVFEVIEGVILDELSDMLTWRDGVFEFFEHFTLQDALAPQEMPRIYFRSFDVQALLLEVHHRIDELRRRPGDVLLPQTVLHRTLKPASNGAPALVDRQRRLLERVDGKRPLHEVCTVLGGNRLTHLRRFHEFIDWEMVKPYTRSQAFEKGTMHSKCGELPTSITFFEHALTVTGDSPSDTELRSLIAHTQTSLETRLLPRLVRKFTDLWTFAAKFPPFGAAGKWMRRHAQFRGVVKWFAHNSCLIRDRITHRWFTLNSSFEKYLIRKGWARYLWIFRDRVIEPATRIASTPTVRVGLIVAVPLAVMLALVIPGIPSGNVDNSANLTGLAPPVVSAKLLKTIAVSFHGNGPVEEAPVFGSGRLYFVARDGQLYCRPRPGAVYDDQSTAVWELDIGEFGDILARPAVTETLVFVANVCGEVTAVSTDGEIVWRRVLPRLERIQPVPLFSIVSEQRTLKAVAVVSRASVLILDAETGQTIYRLQTSNVVTARPIANGPMLYVGSRDNHVYHVNWEAKEIQWDREVSGHVVQILAIGERLIIATRNRRLTALDIDTGKSSWRREVPEVPTLGFDELDSNRLYIEGSNGTIDIIDAGTGSILERFVPPQRFGAQRMIPHGNQYLYVSTAGRVGGLDLAGQPIWVLRNALEGVRTFAPHENLLAVVDQNGGVHLFEISDEVEDE